MEYSKPMTLDYLITNSQYIYSSCLNLEMTFQNPFFQTLLLDITVLKILTRKSDYKTRIKTKSSKVLTSFNVYIRYLARKFKGLFLKIKFKKLFLQGSLQIKTLWECWSIWFCVVKYYDKIFEYLILN